MILNLFRKLRETLDLKIEATEGIFSCLCDFLFLLKFMLKGEIFGLHDTKQFVNSGMGKKISFREFFPLQYYFLLYLRDFGGHSAVLVLEVVFDGLGQVKLSDLALLNTLLGDGLTNDTATKIQKWQRFSCKKNRILKSSRFTLSNYV